MHFWGIDVDRDYSIRPIFSTAEYQEETKKEELEVRLKQSIHFWGIDGDRD